MTLPLPREHGAWGLLLQPFFAGLLLANSWTWTLLPALGLLLSGFLLREPLTVLARQRWVWRTHNPQSDSALRWFAVESATALLCFALLANHLPALPLAALALTAGAFTLLAVWFTIRNQQRNIALQLSSAAGLGTTALLAIFSAKSSLPPWAWQLWALLTAHAVLSILVVRTRLRIRSGHVPSPPRYAYVIPFLPFLLIPILPPLLFSAAANVWELRRLNNSAAVNEPLKRVGFRALFTSIAHALITIATLWPAANP